MRSTTTFCAQRTILGCFYIVFPSVNASSGIVFFALENNDQQGETKIDNIFYGSWQRKILNNILFFRFQPEDFDEHKHALLDIVLFQFDK